MAIFGALRELAQSFGHMYRDLLVTFLDILQVRLVESWRNDFAFRVKLDFKRSERTFYGDDCEQNQIYYEGKKADERANGSDVWRNFCLLSWCVF